MVPIFIGFAILINVQREEGQKRIYKKWGIPYKSAPHMVGSPILFGAGAIVASYFILRRGPKKTEGMGDSRIVSTVGTTACLKCKAEVSSDSVYCHKCGNKIGVC